jgi:tetratricopeptide (TPR) repeat protein
MGRYDQAEQEFKVAASLSPLNVHARNRMGLLYLREGRPAAAEREFPASLAIAPNVVAFNALGEFFKQRNDRFQAERAFKAALALNPADLEARLDLASLYAAAGLLSEAAEQYREVLRIDPLNPHAAASLEKIARGGDKAPR